MENRTSESGVALVVTLFLLGALSALSVSLMFLAQTETASSRNYKTMSQARYAGEAGIHKAMNYLLYTYPVPGNISSYNINASPVTCAAGCTVGNPIILSAYPTAIQASNYPDSAVQTAFNTAAQGTLAVGTGTVTYRAYAELVAMQQIDAYGVAGSTTVQTWRITADGIVDGPQPALVQVTAMVERQIVPAGNYATFATGTGCGAITMGGTADTDSYDSSNLGAGFSNNDGNVGTNGNLSISGSVDVQGTLSTPRTGVGGCSANAVTALTESGHAEVSAGIVPLAQEINFPTPDPPSPPPGTDSVNINSGVTCATLVAQSGTPPTATCTYASSTFTIAPVDVYHPVVLGNVALTGGANVVLDGGTYNLNSITMAGNSNLHIGTGTVVMKIAGDPGLAMPVDLTGGSFFNTSKDPTRFQILYGGTGQVKFNGGNDASAMIYAPNAAMTMAGNSDFYGSTIVRSANYTGNATLHYDRNLRGNFFTLGNWVMTSFSWKKQ